MIPFLSPKQIDDLFGKEIDKYLKENEPSLSADLAQKVQENTNKKMETFTLKALLRRLWKYLTSKITGKNQDEDKKTYDDLSNALSLLYNMP